ncbi:DODA-type extradiol aromatic ring-opening family dioxygenase [Eoetvoesiella caeni]
MAKIILGIGASHTPLLTLSTSQWQHRAAADYANEQLNMSDGRLMTYSELLAEVGPQYADVATPDILNHKADLCSRSLDKLGDALAAAAPDVVIIVGDDQRELFSASNQPAIAVFHGDEVITSDVHGREENPEWIREMGRGYFMDKTHVFPGASAFAFELIKGLMQESFDVASSGRVDDPKAAGFGHAYGFIIKRLFRGREIPVVPVLLNTYYEPNVPTSARCYDLGRAIQRVVEASPTDLRIAIIASGGLSHFIVDEALDQQIIGAISSSDAEVLRSIPREALNAGSSEILNWIVAAGAMATTPLRWVDYYPLYRTPAGTCVGAGFAVWSES